MISATIEGFADDISATVVDDTPTLVLQTLQKDATNVLKFMASNRLIANDKKTTFILFGNRSSGTPNLSLIVGNSKIEEQSSIKLLGLNISNDLKWNIHVNHMLTTLHHRIYLFNHIRDILPNHIIPTVSNALVMSHFRYVLPIFVHPRLSEHDPLPTNTNRLQIAQNQMTRSWLQVKRSDKVNMRKARSELGLMSVNQLAVFTILTETRKILINDTIPWMKAIMTERGSSSITTRSNTSNKLRSQQSQTQKHVDGFIHQAATLWNSIPSDCRDLSCSDSLFKRTIKNWITTNLP